MNFLKHIRIFKKKVCTGNNKSIHLRENGREGNTREGKISAEGRRRKGSERKRREGKNWEEKGREDVSTLRNAWHIYTRKIDLISYQK